MISDLKILFEDEAVLVIAKPPGLVVNRAESVTEETLQDWMEKQTWFGSSGTPADWQDEEQMQIYTERSGIVHRLDKDTSGVLLLAKHPRALHELLRQFRERETEKTYLSLVHGKFSSPSGTILLPLARSSNDRERFTVDPEGRVSETSYVVLEYFPQAPKFLGQKKAKSYQGFSLMELQPKTGRTHQIRVHMSYIKHPLVGDLKYVGRKRSRVDLEWCPRQFLHAKQLKFTHPTSGERIVIEAPLPQDLEEVLEKLRQAMAG
jgi:23S rRNA pseudouridine1911/1915/1917 synthase